jgi:hypothetical protein
LSFTVPSSAAMKVPDVVGVREVVPTAAAGLLESPSVAAAKFADLLTVGAKSPYAGLFAVTPEVSKLQNDLADSHAIAGSHEILSVTDTFTVNAPPAAFRTASGDVLAFFTLTDANLMRPQYGAMWPVGQNTAAFSTPNQLYRNALTTTLLYQVALAIPAKKERRSRRSASPANWWTPAATEHYNDINNKANSTRNSKLIATIEGGNLVRESQAGYTIDQYAKAKPAGTFTYTKPVIGAPQFGSYPMRFVTSSWISDNAKYRHLGLWERETAGSRWMMTFAAGVPTTVKLPDLTGIRPATKADDTKLAVAPQFAATAWRRT